MVNYQTISALVDQIPADTWNVLREIKERRPAMMLLELIDCRRRALQKQEPPETRSQTTNPHNTPPVEIPPDRQHAEAAHPVPFDIADAVRQVS